MREAEYAIFADKHNWKYAWFGEHHWLTEYSHMSAPEVVMGYVAGADRLHPPGVRHQQPFAAQGAPGAARRAGRDARPRHRPPLRVGHRPRRRQPRDGQLQHPGHELHQVRVGRGRPRDPAHVGAEGLLVRGRALHRADAAQRAAQALRPGPPADLGRVRQPADVRTKAGELGIGAIAFNFEPIYNLRGPHRGLQGGRSRTAPSRSGSS